MRSIKYLALAALVAFAACDEDTDPGTVPQATGTVQVTVTAAGTGVAGVTVSLGAAGSQPAQTNAQGQVTFSNVAAGPYTVSISGLSTDLACPQTSQPVTVGGGQTTSVQFACNLVQTASLAGSVTNTNGTAFAGATVTITRTAPAPAGTPVVVTTGNNGQFALTGLRSGTYTVVLATTANCTTAATTQTVTIAAGEARVVNFTCTTAPPPPAVEPATVAIESITANTFLGGQVTVPDNAVAGIVNVNIDVNEGGQRVTRVELYLGTTLVCTQNRAVAAPEQEQELADFEVTCVVNTAAFNQTTGAVNFRNVALPPDGTGTFFEARIYTVAAGGTNAAATARRAIGLSNVDFIYMRLTPERRVAGGTAQTGLAAVGVTWMAGNLTIESLPVVYSAAVVSSLTVTLNAFSPLSVGTIGNVTTPLTRAAYLAAVPVVTNSVSRDLTAAPWSTTLLSTNSITAGQNGSRGTGDIEDLGAGAGGSLNLTATTIASQGVGPVSGAITTVCSDGRVPSFVVFPNASGCADGQPAQPIRFDGFAPLVDQMDQSLRYTTSYTAGCPPDTNRVVGCASNAITRWVSEGKTFSFTTSGNNSTLPRATDRGTGTGGTVTSTFRAGRTTAGVTAITSTASLDGDTFDNNVFFLNASVTDVGGNTRTIWNNNTSSGATGTGTGNNSIATLEGTAAVGQMPANGAKFGRDTPDPCFTVNGVDCADGFIGTLKTTGQVIGVAGTPTIGGGGVMDGSVLLTQRMDRLNSANGDPGWAPTGAATGDYGAVITRIRREGSQPGSATANSQTQRCWVGLIDDNECVEAGGGDTTASGINGSFEFMAGSRYSTVSATSGTVTNVTAARDGTPLDFTVRPDAGVGFYHVNMRLIDGAGNQGPMSFRRFVRDVSAPISAGVIYPVSVAPAGQVTISSISQDELALAKSEAYLAFTGATHSFRQNEQTIMAFPSGTAYNDGFPYITSFNPSATFGFTSHLIVGSGNAATFPATNFVFRIFDHGRNVAEATSTGVPAVTPAPAAAPVITSAGAGLGLAASNSNVCWDTDTDGCGTNSGSTSLSFTVTSSLPNQVPFNRVEFYVGRDANNDGALDLDTAGRQMWGSLGVSGGSAVGNTFTWTRIVTGEQIATAAGRTTLPPAGSAVAIRVVGYMPNGQAFTVANASVACSTVGADAQCLLLLTQD